MSTRQKSFGYFRNEGTEFVITTPHTPRSLINYFWNKSFISGISHHGTGEGVYKDRALQYIDKRGRNLMIRDGQKYFYIFDCDDSSFWSPGWQPVQAPLDSFECVHGLGYSILSSKRKGIEISMRVFVPEKEPCEI